MDLSGFYAVVSAINFTLLGLWWVVVIELPEMTRDDPASRRMAYLVSLQFLIPGTMSLLSQVAPDVTILWRASFAFASLLGAVAVTLLAIPLWRADRRRVAPRLLLWGAAPLYVLIALVAVSPQLTEGIRGDLTPLQVEALLLCLMVFLGVQTAWVAATTPQERSG